MTIIETNRLTLREFTLADAPFILKLLNTPGWLEFIGNRNMNSIAEAEKYISNILINSYIKNGYGLYLIELKEKNIPVGMCGLVKRNFLDDTDLGFALLPEFEGNGYAYESALAILQYSKTNWGLNRLLAITVKENSASIKLLEKLNFIFEKIIEDGDSKEELMLFTIRLIN